VTRPLFLLVLVLAVPLAGWTESLRLQAAAAALQEIPEADAKALFIHQFARYTQWAEKDLPPPGQPMTFGVLGPKAKAEKLSEIIRSKSIGGRPIRVIQGDTPAALKGAHLVFLTQEEKEQTEALLDIFRKTPTLTVGESEGFAESGGVLNFYFAEQGGKARLKFELNPAAADRAGLKVTQLATVAPRIVKEK
jgi:hypothetical protein